MIEGDEEISSENLRSWRITSITKTQLKISLRFFKPINVSQGDIKDSLLVFVNLRSFKDGNGVNFPRFLFLNEILPPQNPSADEIEAVQASGDAAATGTAAIMSSSFLVNLVFSVSMASLWSMVEVL